MKKDKKTAQEIMTKLTHSQKLKKARKMMTSQERQDNISPWDSYQWRQHKNANRCRIQSIFPLKGTQVIKEIKKGWWRKLLDFLKKIIYN